MNDPYIPTAADIDADNYAREVERACWLSEYAHKIERMR